MVIKGLSPVITTDITVLASWLNTPNPTKLLPLGPPPASLKGRPAPRTPTQRSPARLARSGQRDGRLSGGGGVSFTRVSYPKGTDALW